jgi:[ribosomal protein S18]-alanine N-acetyltransferase
MNKAEQYSVEEMRLEDIEAVAAIEKASFEDPWSIESFKTELEQNRLALYYVARHANEIVAYIGAWQVIDEIHITTLAVAAPYRRRGIAGMLLKTLIEKVRPDGVRCLTLEVRPSNNSARSFYEKYGFRVLGRRKRYYHNEDALIMTREGLVEYEA